MRDRGPGGGRLVPCGWVARRKCGLTRARRRLSLPTFGPGGKIPGTNVFSGQGQLPYSLVVIHHSFPSSHYSQLMDLC